MQFINIVEINLRQLTENLENISKTQWLKAAKTNKIALAY